MNRVLWFLFVVCLLLICLPFLEKLRRESTLQLDKVLYVDHNPQLYLKLLENKRLRLVYSKTTIKGLQLDAYLMMQDHEKIIETMNILESAPMGKGAKLEFNEKKLSYYCLKGNQVKAKEALDAIHQLLDKVKKDKYQKIVVDSDIIYGIYIDKDVSLIDDLEKQVETQEGSTKGITLFRLAKLYLIKQESKRCISMLQQATSLVKGTSYEEIVKECLNNLAKLDEY